MTRLNGFAGLAAAAAIAIGPAVLARADAPSGPRVVGSGENASLEYPVPSENIVGGALTRTVGSGESETTEVIAVQKTTPGQLSHSMGSGESQEQVYLDAHAAQAGQRG